VDSKQERGPRARVGANGPWGVASAQAGRHTEDSPAVPLRIIAGLLIVGAAWLTAELLVPFVLAMVLAITLSPVADRLERWRLPRAVAALACTLAVLGVMVLGVGVALYQAGTIARDSEKYVRSFSQLLDKVTQWTDGARTLSALGLMREDGGRSGRGEPGAESDQGRREEGGAGDLQDGRGASDRSAQPDWQATLHRNLGLLGRWVVRGVGGLLGFVGGSVIFLAALFYMLQTRGDWLERFKGATSRLGMTPRDEQLEKIRGEMVRFVGCLTMVACGYVVVVSLALWALGVPQPLLWGLVAGLFEVVPYFGPLIASVLPTLVALSLGAWWKPVVVAGLFLTLHLVEGYLITPQLYGRAVKFDPLTVLFGALFFGWLWGPAGLAVAMPMLIILRGILLITPGTTALDALADLDEEKEPALATGAVPTS
jgi:predicted PurR-regulated permease PerM